MEIVEVKTPVLATVTNDSSNLARFSSVKGIMAANRKQIQTYRLFYIEETGHFPMLEKPAEFNRILTDALKYIEDQKK